MDTTKKTRTLRSKRVVIPAIAAAAVLGVGSTWWAASADDVRGDTRDRVASAALDAAGGGTVTEVETSDDRGEAYEVEIRKDDGTEVDIALDENLAVVGQETDLEDNGADDNRALTDAERTSAEQAALAAVGGGTVTEVEASDDRGEAYEVEVRKDDGTEWDVTLDAGFKVIDQEQDR